MIEQCVVCGKPLLGTNIKKYKQESYCLRCFEIKSLIDGLILDIKIEKVEHLLSSGQVQEFSRGRMEIN